MEPVPCKRIRLEASVDDQDESLQRSESDHPTDSVAESDWLTEMDVGIRAFVNPDVPGFDCTLKTRYRRLSVSDQLFQMGGLHGARNFAGVLC